MSISAQMDFMIFFFLLTMIKVRALIIFKKKLRSYGILFYKLELINLKKDKEFIFILNLYNSRIRYLEIISFDCFLKDFYLK